MCLHAPAPRIREGMGLTKYEVLPAILLYSQKQWTTSTSGKKKGKKSNKKPVPLMNNLEKKGGREGGEKKKKKPVPLMNNVGGLKPGCRPGCMSFSYFQPLGI